MSSNTFVRRGNLGDAERIVEIWKLGVSLLQKIDLSQAEDPLSFFRSLLANLELDKRFGFWILENANRIVGWQGLLPFCPSPLEWRYWAFSSVYIERRCGIPEAGSKVMTTALEEAGRAGLAQVFAYISPENRVSIRLAKRVGWIYCGRVPCRSRGPMTCELEFYTYTFPGGSSQKLPLVNL